MPLYGMINVAVQFDLSKVESNIDVFKSIYGVTTEEEVYTRYLSDMSKTIVSSIEGVEGVSYEARLQGVARDEEKPVSEVYQDLVDEALVEASETPLDDNIEHADAVIHHMRMVEIDFGMVKKVVVNESRESLMNFSKILGVPVEKAEMQEDYYLIYEEYGTGEEKTWSPEGEENK